MQLQNRLLISRNLPTGTGTESMFDWFPASGAPAEPDAFFKVFANELVAYNAY